MQLVLWVASANAELQKLAERVKELEAELARATAPGTTAAPPPPAGGAPAGERVG